MVRSRMRVVKAWMQSVKLSKATQQLVDTFYNTTWLEKQQDTEQGIYAELPFYVREAATFDMVKYVGLVVQAAEWMMSSNSNPLHCYARSVQSNCWHAATLVTSSSSIAALSLTHTVLVRAHRHGNPHVSLMQVLLLFSNLQVP